MQTKDIKENTNFKKTIINHIDNISIKIYETQGTFCFRIYQFIENREIDPVAKSEKKNWGFGPYKSQDEALEAGKSLMRTLYK